MEAGSSTPSSKIQVEYAETHTPLFLAGKNLGTKLDPKKHSGLHMEFDNDKNRMLISWGIGSSRKTAQVPEAAMAYWIEATDKQETLKEVPKVEPAKPFKAQVSTPQQHVFEPGKPLAARTLEKGGVKL